MSRSTRCNGNAAGSRAPGPSGMATAAPDRRCAAAKAGGFASETLMKNTAALYLLWRFARRAIQPDAAENLLKRRGKNCSKITTELMDVAKYESHVQMIGWKPATDVVWCKYWALYCHLRLAIESEQRIFESNYVSLLL